MNDCKDFDKLTPDEQRQVHLSIEHNFDYIEYAFVGLINAILLSGIAIVFIWRKENFKPTFIKVIWVFLCLAELTVIPCWVILRRLEKLYNNPD